MIATVESYSATVAAPTFEESERVMDYRPLVERIVLGERDIDEVVRQLRLVLKSRAKPLVVIFEPEFMKELRHNGIVTST